LPKCVTVVIFKHRDQYGEVGSLPKCATVVIFKDLCFESLKYIVCFQHLSLRSLKSIVFSKI
jgi:hypothetical protein